MKPTGTRPPKADVFSIEVADALLTALDTFHEARWFHRARINSKPTQGDPTASYDFCGDRQQPRDFNRYLRSIAPDIEGATLAEACVNRYRPGDYMPEHIDVAMYRHNVVVALNSDGDGVDLDGCFQEDVPGQGIIFSACSSPHRVPAVTQQRYVIIYLYE